MAKSDKTGNTRHWHDGDAVYAFHTALLYGGDDYTHVPGPIKCVITEKTLVLDAPMLKLPRVVRMAPVDPMTGSADEKHAISVDGWDFADTLAEITELRSLRIQEAINRKQRQIRTLIKAQESKKEGDGA